MKEVVNNPTSLLLVVMEFLLLHCSVQQILRIFFLMLKIGIRQMANNLPESGTLTLHCNVSF